MKLQVIGRPTVTSDGPQKIHISYSPSKECTIITCDADLVTLGIAVNVLQQLFNAGVEKLDTATADELTKITRRVVKRNA